MNSVGARRCVDLDYTRASKSWYFPRSRKIYVNEIHGEIHGLLLTQFSSAEPQENRGEVGALFAQGIAVLVDDGHFPVMHQTGAA